MTRSATVPDADVTSSAARASGKGSTTGAASSTTDAGPQRVLLQRQHER